MGSRPDVLDLYAGFDVFCLSSWMEGMPNVVIEAMAAGCPVVATDVGGVRETLGGSGGICIQPGDLQGLVESLRELLLSAELRHKLSTAGRRRVEKCFSIAKMVREFETLYCRLVDNRRWSKLYDADRDSQRVCR